jgi:serine/threonine-protein kinase
VHKEIKRTVALKILHPSGAGETRERARFRVEGEVSARLDHPNIVYIHEFNESEGMLYLAMELVEGETLARRLARGSLPLREAAELVQTIASAVEYAHRQNVIHRDLKPSNVLLARDGTPKVSDFSLAKILEEGREKLTATDAVMGTLVYMAPEQAAGRTSEIGTRTDVYALGTILYESLTGVPPFPSGSKIETLALVQAGNVIPPSRHREDIPANLEAVCLKCLATAPADRFPSAEAIAEDLGRWLRGDLPPPRRPGRLQRLLRRVKDRRVIAVVSAVVLGAGLIWTIAAILPRTNGSAVPDGESEAVRRELEAELDAGRPVALVGETSWPKWFRWRAGKHEQRTQIESDGTFSAEMLHPHTSGLLELLPDPRTDRYKLNAQVRHDLGNSGNFVGLYVAHRAYPRQPRDIQFFAQVRFESVAASGRPIVLGQPNPVPANHTQHMSLALRVLTDRIAPLNMDHPWNETRGPRLLARGPRNGEWHDLEVTVTPKEVVASVDGNRMELPAVGLQNESLHAGIQVVREAFPADAVVQNLRLEFAPRGGLGLVLYPLAAASVRRVTVTPLPTGR